MWTINIWDNGLGLSKIKRAIMTNPMTSKEGEIVLLLSTYALKEIALLEVTWSENVWNLSAKYRFN